MTPGYGTQEFKHSYQFDVSLANSGAPTGLSNGYAFSYDITLAQLVTSDTWDLYPFVPFGSGTPMTVTTNAFNYAGTGNIVINLWNDNLGADQGKASFPMGAGTVNTPTFPVSAAQTNATWHLQFVTGNGTFGSSGRVAGAAELYFSIGGSLLPMYSAPSPGPRPTISR